MQTSFLSVASLPKVQLTKLKEDVKAKIEEHFQPGGQRTAAQVRSITLPALMSGHSAEYIAHIGSGQCIG